jgi:hypothetical protein
MRRMRSQASLLAAMAAAGLLAGCTSGGATTSTNLPQASEAVSLDPADFTVNITNKYWPMKPGDTYVYEEKDYDGHVSRSDLTVLQQTATINGIQCRVVHDLVTSDGQTIEDTTDWYAQDSAGNLWYLGEKTTEFENGKPSTHGSWTAGQDGAQPGILLPAAPKTGMSFRQEYRKDEAEDRSRVLSTDERVQVPTGTYQGAMLTRDTTPLEPDLVELKWYVPGVGPVLTLTPAGEASRQHLVQSPAH